MNLAFPEDRPQPFWQGRLRWLRLSQGILAVCAAAFLSAAVYYVWAVDGRSAEEARARTLAGVMEEMNARRQEEARRGKLCEEARAFAAGDPAWESRLILLADAVPPGVVIRRLEGGSGEIILTGTARDSGALSDFQRRLSAAWDMQGRTEFRRTGKRYSEFSLHLGREAAP